MNRGRAYRFTNTLLALLIFSTAANSYAIGPRPVECPQSGETFWAYGYCFTGGYEPDLSDSTLEFVLTSRVSPRSLFSQILFENPIPDRADLEPFRKFSDSPTIHLSKEEMAWREKHGRSDMLDRIWLAREWYRQRKAGKKSTAMVALALFYATKGAPLSELHPSYRKAAIAALHDYIDELAKGDKKQDPTWKYLLGELHRQDGKFAAAKAIFSDLELEDKNHEWGDWIIDGYVLDKDDLIEGRIKLCEEKDSSADGLGAILGKLSEEDALRETRKTCVALPADRKEGLPDGDKELLSILESGEPTRETMEKIQACYLLNQWNLSFAFEFRGEPELREWWRSYSKRLYFGCWKTRNRLAATYWLKSINIEDDIVVRDLAETDISREDTKSRFGVDHKRLIEMNPTLAGVKLIKKGTAIRRLNLPFEPEDGIGTGYSVGHDEDGAIKVISELAAEGNYAAEVFLMRWLGTLGKSALERNWTKSWTPTFQVMRDSKIPLVQSEVGTPEIVEFVQKISAYLKSDAGAKETLLREFQESLETVGEANRCALILEAFHFSGDPDLDASTVAKLSEKSLSPEWMNLVRHLGSVSDTDLVKQIESLSEVFRKRALQKWETHPNGENPWINASIDFDNAILKINFRNRVRFVAE